MNSFVGDMAIMRRFVDSQGVPAAIANEPGDYASTHAAVEAWRRLTTFPPAQEGTTMTESEWLTSDDPGVMLDWLKTGRAGDSANLPLLPCPVAVSDRKLRLFACACCRQVWERFDDRGRTGVETVERFADNCATWEEVRLAVDGADGLPHRSNFGLIGQAATHGAVNAAWNMVHRFRTDQRLPRVDLAALLRDIVGNPFRPVSVDCDICAGTGRLGTNGMSCEIGDPDWEWCHGCEGHGGVPWLTSTALTIAQATYSERLPDGTLDPYRLAVLSDALEEAGCTSEEILRCCRGERPCVTCICTKEADEAAWAEGCTICGGSRWVPDWWTRTPSPTPPLHVRGCWVLDLILGKE